MADRGKVLRALKQHLLAPDVDECEACPYGELSGLECERQLYRDAVELLKAQEPRVLTWEEVKKAEVCWLETRGYEPFATLEADTWNPEKYGKSYRCWNRMPTDEQRKAVKWD